MAESGLEPRILDCSASPHLFFPCGRGARIFARAEMGRQGRDQVRPGTLEGYLGTDSLQISDQQELLSH